jgi:hypothetical protein
LAAESVSSTGAAAPLPRPPAREAKRVNDQIVPGKTTERKKAAVRQSIWDFTGTAAG